MTAPNPLPFSPLTLAGLDQLREEAARSAANALTYHRRMGGSSLAEDAARALPHAVRYDDMLAAAVARADAEAEAQR